MQPDQFEFDHAFPSCSRTYATLVILSDVLTADAVTQTLQVEPDNTWEKGERRSLRRTTKNNGWSITTRDANDSKDVRAHIADLLAQVPNCLSNLKRLKDAGYKIIVHCFWESSNGNGGPVLDNNFLRWVADYPLDVHFDIWFADEKAA